MALARATALRRCFSSAPGAATAAAEGPSFVEGLLFDTPSQPRLTEQIAGVPAPSGVAAQAPGAVEVTKLPNGVTVASQQRHGAYTSVSFTAKAGSRADVVPGTAFALKNLAFGATQLRSAAKLTRDIDDFAGVVGASADRESVQYTAGALQEHTTKAVEVLAETVMRPKLAPWEVSEAAALFAAVAEEETADPAVAIAEDVHAAAFGRAAPLGRPAAPFPEHMAAVSGEAIRAYMGDQFRAQSVVVAGVNVDHAQLVDLADIHFLGVPEGKAPKAPKAAVVGGDVLTRTATGASHVAVALAAPGTGDADAPAAAVLRALLGSTRGGYVNRSLCAGLASKHAIAADLASFGASYSDAGLLGLTGLCADADAGALIDLMAGALKDAAAASDEDVARAKASAKLALAVELEGWAGALKHINAQLLGGGDAVTPVDAALAALDAVTPADVAAVAAKALKAPASLAVRGSLETVPRYDHFAALFQ